MPLIGTTAKYLCIIIKTINTMKKNSIQPGEYFSLNEMLSVMRQELDDAREEHDRLSSLLMRHYDDDDSYILEDYVDDLQEYIDEMEDLTDNIDRVIDIKHRLSDDLVQINAALKRLGIL